jgi:hypothetical protein
VALANFWDASGAAAMYLGRRSIDRQWHVGGVQVLVICRQPFVTLASFRRSVVVSYP